ncbi:MAG: hypothetical protein DME22_11710 [Verrucomicrobia bacterium]|nr:MAG: hypothetical protein DME22_11710 [Verrucomicrobiota bacterium]
MRPRDFRRFLRLFEHGQRTLHLLHDGLKRGRRARVLHALLDVAHLLQGLLLRVAHHDNVGGIVPDDLRA